ncbi:hypothetical protein RA086_05900 [Lactiplantibacillus sp. WILCCON 0030]|uniref:SnoaL-like domain-containing protein n=1 Tax=Lactiplantibacillus brownii TaxID=3069269 RepID=A0ABU1A9Q0_9LACO|nr:hypothetical protein [Lactiplantibacillus brownii]MDQ7937158.1 hypothetical protein [Lactiplantibacillus brownii]
MTVDEHCFVVEWYFKARETTIIDFDGVSVIEFRGARIAKLTEYETKHATFRPFSA